MHSEIRHEFTKQTRQAYVTYTLVGLGAIAMMLESSGRRPRINPSTYVAPNATLCGDVRIGEGSAVLFGAIITADGGPVKIGRNCIVMENAVIRGTKRHPTSIGDNVLVGPRAYLTGCTVSDNVFLATGSSVFNGAKLGERTDVRINGTVHVNTVLKPDQVVPIGWVAVGNPAKVFPPGEHEKIWRIQKELNFPQTVWGLERRRRKGETIMPEVARRYTRALVKHKDDRILDQKDKSGSIWMASSGV